MLGFVLVSRLPIRLLNQVYVNPNIHDPITSKSLTRFFLRPSLSRASLKWFSFRARSWGPLGYRDLMSPVISEQHYKNGMKKDENGFMDIDWCCSKVLNDWDELRSVFMQANAKKAIAPTQVGVPVVWSG